MLQEPKAYVEALLEVHTKNAELVQRAFRGDPTFGASLDKVGDRAAAVLSSMHVRSLASPPS